MCCNEETVCCNEDQAQWKTNQQTNETHTHTHTHTQTLSSEFLLILLIWTGFVTLYDQKIVAEVSYMNSKSRPQVDLWISILSLTPMQLPLEKVLEDKRHIEGSLVVLTNITLEQPVCHCPNKLRAQTRSAASCLLADFRRTNEPDWDDQNK